MVANHFGFNKHNPMRSKSDLVNGHQKAAYDILRATEQNAKRSRLECLLIQQLTGKYGSKNINSKINAFIRTTVADFLNSYKNINVAESMLDTLEAQIREICGTMKLEASSKRMEILRAQHAAATQNSADEGDQGGKSRKGSSQNRARTPTLDDPNQWSVLNAILALSDEEKERKKQAEIAAKKEKFRIELEKQRNEIHAASAKAEEEKKKALLNSNTNIAAFDDEKKVAREQKITSHRTEKVLIESQIEHRRRLREEERQAKILQEKASVERAKRLIVEEEETRALKKEQQKLAQERVKEENERNKKLKEEAKQKQWEYEAKLNRDYEAKLDREEASRAKAFQDRIDQLKAIEKAYEGQAGKAIMEQQKAEESLTLSNMEKKYRDDEEKERVKQEKRRIEMEKSKEFNLMLIEKKARQKQEERERDIQHRLRCERDAQESKIKEAKKAEEKRLAMAELKIKLDSQVHFRHQQIRDKGALSDIEKELNKTLIKKITESPDLLNRVIDKVKPPAAAPNGTGGFKWG